MICDLFVFRLLLIIRLLLIVNKVNLDKMNKNEYKWLICLVSYFFFVEK